MRSSLRRGLVLTALAGTCVMAAAPAALAATPATQSPEAIALVASGPIVTLAVGDATIATSPQSLLGGGVTGLLDIGALTDIAQNTSAPPGNEASSTVASLGAASSNLLNAILGNLIAATVIKSTCTWNSNLTGSSAFTETTTIASLTILGTTVTLPATIAPNTSLLSLLPTLPTLLAPLNLLGLTGLTITLNQQEPGPGSNTETVNAIDISLGAGALLLGSAGTEHIDVASSTCGNPTSIVASPVAGGKGLGIGLGLLGLLGAGFAAAYARRRRVLASA
jgi:hypothetical protein